MRARHLAAVLAVSAAVGLAAAQPSVAISSPTADDVVTGPTTFAVDAATLPRGARDVTFYVDGVRACTGAAPELRCDWDVGLRVASRHVRAVVRLDDGRQLSAALRTKDVDVTLYASVDAVVVAATVKRGRDRFVDGLTIADFRLFEDGRRQTLTSVTTEDAAADVVLLLDISASMEPAMDDLRASARRFIAAMRPQDRLTLAGFNDGLFVIAGPSADRAARLAQLERVKAFGRTSLYDSLVRAADLFRTASGRRALVVFTDGDDVASRGSAETARTALQGKDVVLYVAGQGKAADDRELRDRLQRLAEETGGAAYFANRMSALDGHFADVLRTIGHQYVLTYTPERPMGDGAWRTVRVELANGRHDVQARQGYFARRSTAK
ncbi:MAG: VWA domain-containing protein [Vicinamibacterales bacterium]